MYIIKYDIKYNKYIVYIVQRGGSGSSDIMSSQSDECQVDRLFVTDTITITSGTITKGPSQK